MADRDGFRAASQPPMTARSLVRTAAYNVVRMGSGFALVAILPVLARRLEPAEYSLWVLVGQVPGYVTLLASGLSVAVVRTAAAAPGPRERADAVDAGLHYGRLMALVTGSAVLVAAPVFPLFFQDIPSDLHTTARIGAAVLGVGAAWGLAGTAHWSYFNAVKDNGPSALLTATLRLAGALVTVALIPWGLAAMFVGLAITLGLGSTTQHLLYKRSAAGSLERSSGSTPAREELRSYLATFAIWAAVGLLSNGLDVAIVGALDYGRVGSYGAAAAVVTVFGGVYTAVMSAFLPDAAQGNPETRRRSMETAIRAGGLLAWMFVGITAAIAQPAMGLVFGDQLASDAAPILLALVAGRAIGQLIWPYIVGVLAVGDHRQVRATPIVEGLLNFGLSVVLVATIGAIGAAIGSLVATFVATLLHLFVNVPRTPAVEFDRRQWLRLGVVRASVPAMPLVALGAISRLMHSDVPAVVAGGLVVSSCLLATRELMRVRRVADGLDHAVAPSV